MGRARTRSRAVVASCLLLFPALVLSACGDGSSSASATPTSGTTSSVDPTDPTSVPSADPSSSSGDPTDHAVDRPGPFRAPLYTADMLIFRQQPLSDRMVRRIRQVPGVTKVEQFSLAQVSIEDHAINVAAVDPATYRNFNPDAVALFQPEWNRIAAGEMALRKGFSKQVAQDDFVRLGARADAPQGDVGAHSPPIPPGGARG